MEQVARMDYLPAPTLLKGGPNGQETAKWLKQLLDIEFVKFYLLAAVFANLPCPYWVPPPQPCHNTGF
jgi:hypothetical protein